MSKEQTIKVRALTNHTFNGKSYEEGDTYEVAGDGTQTAEQYVMTLGAISFAEVDDGTKPDKKAKAKEDAKEDASKYETRELKAKK